MFLELVEIQNPKNNWDTCRADRRRLHLPMARRALKRPAGVGVM